MKTKEKYAVIPFNSSKIKGKYLVSNLLGKWDILDKDEFRKLSSLALAENGKGQELFKRLYDRGIIVDQDNFKGLIKDFKEKNANLFRGTSLHIAVLTTRCNLKCKYCQTSCLKSEDMNYEVAQRIIKHIFDTRERAVTLEFQGGEPILNWDVLVFLVENIRKLNVGKNLKISLVTNLTLLNDEKMNFLCDNKVDICCSLDGPDFLHNKNRFFANGKGTYGTIAKNIKKLNKNFGKKINLLPTITKDSLNFYKEIVDEYVRWGQTSIAIRPVNQMGVACRNWLDLGYSFHQFNDFYKKAMDYILELNKKGIYIRERIAGVMVEKILGGYDPSYVELMNPCGAGRSTLAYMPNGDCYPCDEARMVGEDMFKLGNVLVDKNHGDLMKKENLMHLLQSSVMNLWDYNSAYLPWMGTCPVVNYALQNNIVPKVSCSTIHNIYKFQFNYIFEKIIESAENVKVFKSWLRTKGGKNGAKTK